MAERGRPRSFERTEALRQAMEIFWSKGYEGASLADLTSAMGINAPSLYAAFGSKEALFREAVQRYADTEGARTRRALLEAPDARAAIEGMLLAGAQTCTLNGKPPGCLMVLGAAAGPAQHAPVRGWLCEHRRNMQALILQRLEQGRRDGEIGPDADLAALAAFYATVLHGMSIQARDGADRAALQAVARQAMHAWDALARPPAAAR